MRWIFVLALLALLAAALGAVARSKMRRFYEDRAEYAQQFTVKENRMFPFRYFTDKDGKALPVVAVTGFFRGKDAEDRYHEYVRKGVRVFGITAYKSFPNRAMLDASEGEYERNDTFDYPGRIRDWLCCFKKKARFGFTRWNHTADISESDFYNAEEEDAEKPAPAKKYDFIYVCIKDGDDCPANGWQAVNRNFDLAKKCFPIMCKDFGLKGIVVGREGCGLEKEYGEKLEVTGWLDFHVLQAKMRESKFLFVPNVLDASPRVIAEAITKDLAVLMNRNILCGSKYVVPETGELFTDETDLPAALSKLQNRHYQMAPKEWWKANHSQAQSQKELRDFLAASFPSELKGVERVQFIL